MQQATKCRSANAMGSDLSRFPQLIECLKSTPTATLHFHVGKYAQPDLFVVEAGQPGSRYVVGLKSLSCAAETIKALTEMEHLVKEDDAIISSHIISGYTPRAMRQAAQWMTAINKSEIDTGRDTLDYVGMYRRRREEQDRLLRGEIKRGHKAFGFYPLNGPC